MISKFNFYDLYGYLLPGLVLLSLLLLPLGVVYGLPSGNEGVLALLGIPLAYVAGHVIRVIGGDVLPSGMPCKRGRCYPSEILLEAADSNFSGKFKENLIKKIVADFDLDASQLDQRKDAFLLCRSVLIKSGAVSYGEQFEGMYSLSRGVTVACLIGSAHGLGWLSAAYVPSSLAIGVLIGSSAAVAGAELWGRRAVTKSKTQAALLSLFAILVVAVSGGSALAQGIALAATAKTVLLVAVVIAWFVSWKCYQAYKSFTWEFARAIYRDFYNWQKASEKVSQTETTHRSL